MRRRPVDVPVEQNERPERRQKYRKRKASQAQSVRLVCLVLGAVFLILLLRYLYAHYTESRSRDPFTGLKIDSFQKVRNRLLRKPTLSEGETSQKHNAVGEPRTRHSLLTPEEDDALETDSDGIRYHLIFSTDCTPYQHWQSYLVYYTAMRIQQPGHVTRIASGCKGDDAQNMQKWFENDVAPLSKRFHLQLTPSFSEVKDENGQIVGDYAFFNKPFGLKYWLENSPQIGFDKRAKVFPNSVKEDIVILIDPDMGILRPLTRDFTNDKEVIIAPRRQKHVLSRVVGPGKPFDQVYGFGVQWSRLDLEKIAGEGTPAAKVTPEDGFLYYPVGPPYMGTVADMHQIANKWAEFVPKVYEQYP